MNTRLSYRERRVMQHHGRSAKAVALAERMTVDEVLEVRAQLSARGVSPAHPETTVPGTQLSFQAFDSLMRHNTGPAL